MALHQKRVEDLAPLVHCLHPGTGDDRSPSPGDHHAVDRRRTMTSETSYEPTTRTTREGEFYEKPSGWGGVIFAVTAHGRDLA
jgi:hypothetical protein